MKMMHVYFLNKAKGRGPNSLCAWFTGFGLHFSEKCFEANHVRNNWKELSPVTNPGVHREKKSVIFARFLMISAGIWHQAECLVMLLPPYPMYSRAQEGSTLQVAAPSCWAPSIRVRRCKKVHSPFFPAASALQAASDTLQPSFLHEPY